MEFNVFDKESVGQMAGKNTGEIREIKVPRLTTLSSLIAKC